MSLDEKTRAKIAHPNNPNENFDHLKIECRAKDKIHPHDAFAEELFNKMRTVKFHTFINKVFLLFRSHSKVIQVILHSMKVVNV